MNSIPKSDVQHNGEANEERSEQTRSSVRTVVAVTRRKVQPRSDESHRAGGLRRETTSLAA